MYRLTKNPDVVQRLSDMAFVPIRNDDSDHNAAEYRRWLADGNKPLAVDAVPPADAADGKR